MTIIVIAFLIILSGVFVMSEMAIVSARKARLQQWSESGRTGAGRALALAITGQNKFTLRICCSRLTQYGTKPDGQ